MPVHVQLFPEAEDVRDPVDRGGVVAEPFDLDLLTDFEDPDCCGGVPPGPTTVEQLQVRPNAETSRLKLAAAPLPPMDELSPPTHTIFFQLAADDGPPVFCASIDAVHFRARGNKASFRDSGGGVPPAGGLASIKLRRLSSGSIRMKATGSAVDFATPEASLFRVAIGVEALAELQTPTRCVARVTPVVAGPTGGLQLP
jgi:hypothetical protein